jgi:hypothetical protein
MSLVFNEGGREALVTLRSPCGTLHLGIDQDTDGDAIGFGEPIQVTTSSCSTEQRGAEARLLDLLPTVGTWSVADSDHIVLKGAGEISLTSNHINPQ